MMTYHSRVVVLLVLLPLLGGAVPVTGPAVPTAVAATLPARPAAVRPIPAFRWPLDGVPRPVRLFDPPPQPWLPGHRGVDLAAQPGDVVRSAGAGVVSFAGLVAGRPVVSVSHAAGLRTTYEPVRPSVQAGHSVRPGDPLGVLLAGHAGCPVAACLHWGLRRSDEYLDPLALMGLGRVRLLPTVAGRRGRRVRRGPAGGGGGGEPAGRGGRRCHLGGRGSAQPRSASSAGRRRASRSYSPAWL